MPPMRLQPLEAPDPDRPEEYFLDGSHLYIVQVLPAALPLLLTQTSRGLDDVVMTLGGTALSMKLDQRWKVVVTRQRKNPPALPAVVALEFLRDEEAADERRAEILRSWEPGRFRHAKGIGPIKRGRARRASR